MTDSRTTPDWRPLALTLACLMAGYAIVFRLVPFETRAYFLWPFGALTLYGGSRLSARVAFPLTLGVVAFTDLAIYAMRGDPPTYFFYVCLAASVLLGRWLLTRSQSPARIVGGAVASYALFFLVTNFAAWLQPARDYYKPHTFETLMQSYVEALEFLRMQPGQLDFGLILSFGLFGAHAYLAKAYFPAEQVAVARELR
ncbi:MAG TPA: DUF6580 family putative transport protein [Gemmataceae bacterium]|nr:DUF6580 family putative transport protein [Gemmataceae bacterium]